MDRYPTTGRGPTGPEPADAAGHGTREAPLGTDGVEMFETDASGRLTPVVGRGGSRGVGLSVPGAVVGVLLVTALAFGAGGVRPPTDPAAPTSAPMTATQPDDASDAPASPGGWYGSKGDGGGTGIEKPWVTQAPKTGETGGETGTDKPSAEPTLKPSPKPEPTKAPSERMTLTAKVADGRVALGWTACSADGFAYYKVVRSTDGKVTWPEGDNDTLVAAIGDRSTTTAKDAKAPAGVELWYKVFGVANVDGKLVVRCLSTLVSVTVPKPADPTPKPTAGTGTMSIAVAISDGHPLVKWSTCDSDAFGYYKVVWSKDSTVTWPAGDNDVVAGAIGDRATTKFWDKAAPGGKTLHYRVFCVAKSDGRVLASTPVKAVTTPAAEPPPEPVTLGFTATPTVGGVLLDWETCTSGSFVYYKVVRSQNSNPSYLPWTSGSETIGVIDNAGNSAFQDSAVSSGQTWYYRIQAIGKWNGEKVVIGQTPVLVVTIP